MLEVRKLTKNFHNRRVVDDVSFTVEAGQILGLVGTNGAGKSTCLAMLATILKPDGGSILLNGEDVSAHPDRLRSVMGYVPQDIALYESLTGLDNLKFWGRSYHLKGEALSTAIERVSRITGLSGETLKQRVREYSGGMKRRLNIAVALLHDPELVILDEPTAGIDIDSVEQILEAIETLRAAGKAVIYVGHYMEEIERLATHLCLMNAGKCVLYGAKDELLEQDGEKVTLAELYRQVCRT